ncbi:SCO family protein [Aestuariivirga sp.]|uniref:SCO family protein n=1 Tax=Aestuariivirga sp. TaxID=2650926 RepID=UPI0035939B4C
MTQQDLDQTAVALFAGFTHCPDVCPTTLLRLSNLLEQLGGDADKVRVVLVSVDPERDTPQVLKSYLEAFEGDFTGMTGTPEQLKAFAKAYRLFYEKSGTGSDYTMNHTAGVFLFKKGGAFQGTLDQHEPDDTALRKLKMLTGA